MAKHPHLTKRGDVYQIRRKVPLELVAIVGKAEIKYSLRTSNPTEALERVRTETVKIDQQFASARRKASLEPVADISKTEADRLAAIWLSEVMEEDEEYRRDGLNDREYQKYGEALDIVDAGGSYNFARGDTSLVDFEVGEIIDLHGLNIEKDSEAYRNLAYAVMKAGVTANGLMQQRHAGQVIETPAPPLAPSPPDTSGITVAQLIEAYKADPDRQKLSTKTTTGYAVIFRALSELLGSAMPAMSIDREQCRRVRDVLLKLPPNASKRFPGLSLEEAATLAQDQGLPAITSDTVNSYIQNMSALFRWAVREEYMARNPADRLSAGGVKTKAKDKRRPFSTDQLRAVFSAPLYTGCIDDERGYGKPGPNRPRRGRFWVPLLSLWTGMRLNECCQLDVADIKRIGGIDCVTISEDSEESGDDLEGDDKRVKTSAGERFVPIHPELIKLGFLQYVKGQRLANSRKLFPDLPLGHNGYYSDPFSSWFNGTGRFLDKAGATASRTSFHSFRHNYRDAMREVGIPRERQAALGGWVVSESSTMDDYGDGEKAEALFNEIKKLAYSDLDLSHLYV